MGVVLDRVAALIPPTIPAEDTWSKLLGVDDAAAVRLLGLASEHVSHLHEIHAEGCVNAAKLLEHLGASMLQLAVAHVVHLTRAPKSSAEASDAINSGSATAYVRLAKNFSVSSKVRLGASLRAQPGQPSAAVERTVVAQLIGAYSLCSSYAKIREMLAGTLAEGTKTDSTDYKFALWAYARSIGKQPQFVQFGVTGSEQARTFDVSVSTDATREARGAGPTIEAAEQKAAEHYLLRYVPMVERPRFGLGPKQTHRQPIAATPPKSRLQRLGNLMQRFAIPQKEARFFHTALIHSSYRTAYPGVPDNRVLAHLGSCVLDALASYRLATIIAESAVPSRDFRGHIGRLLGKNNCYLEKGFQVLNLTKLLLIGGTVKGISKAVQVEAFQAVMGAALLGRACPTKVTELLPNQLREWLDNSLLDGAPHILEELRRQKVAQMQAAQPHEKTSAPPERPAAPAAAALSSAPPARKKVPCSFCGLNVWEDCMNLHHANFHSPDNEATINGVPLQRLPFTLLPPGTWDMSQVLDHYRKVAQDRGSGWENREFDPSRLKKIASLSPIRCYVGKEFWNGYVVFEFRDTSRVVLECPIEGNATYVLTGNWQNMISHTKAELRDGYRNHHVRVVHKGDWLHRIRQALR